MTLRRCLRAAVAAALLVACTIDVTLSGGDGGFPPDPADAWEPYPDAAFPIPDADPDAYAPDAVASDASDTADAPFD
jgi:hypothetical protein